LNIFYDNNYSPKRETLNISISSYNIKIKNNHFYWFVFQEKIFRHQLDSKWKVIKYFIKYHRKPIDIKPGTIHQIIWICLRGQPWERVSNKAWDGGGNFYKNDLFPASDLVFRKKISHSLRAIQAKSFWGILYDS